ncbi:tubby-like F-box protein 11 isoform X2 [Phoenix dactylifera]|uniref:Tubby-like F-box protein n=1 Tax=Phoenix dactylifera TaxID=42345 RepID=A0A8B9A1S1_PHODC|nr:tubby-like F-box protein 11 isoform X2 [Phoenix dactylifera]
MSFKSIIQDMRDEIGSISRKGFEVRLGYGLRSRSHRVVHDALGRPLVDALKQSCWANMPPELLRDVLMRIEEAESSWPPRKDVVACAGVCRSWRDIMKEIVKTPELSGKLTFPISLKQPGPRDFSLQCFIKRNRATQTYHLYLGLSQALTDNGKFLLAARKCRRPTCTDYLISLDADDMSKGSGTYIGKLRGPRRMQCVMDSIPASAIEPGGVAPTPTEFLLSSLDSFPSIPFFKSKSFRSENLSGPLSGQKEGKLVLKNKAPRWHEQLQCWCLNFRGRVTVASVKNFQLVASEENGPAGQEHDKVILQFGKVGKDLFTMDYRYPISAFQAFAICLSSFDTKIACE